MSSHTYQALLYGSIATAVVSLLSLGGALIIPLLTTSSKRRWMNFFISLAVSTMSSDAILHIIPQIVGVHNHEHGHSHGHGHEHAKNKTHDVSHENEDEGEHANWYTLTDDRVILLRLSIVIGAVYLLYLWEFIMYYRTEKKSEMHCEQQLSSHAWSGCEPNNNNNQAKTFPTTESTTSQLSHSQNTNVADDEVVVCCGLKSRALLILVGDGVHNFVDGVAIGASFMSSMRLGIITTIAVICHELPHEIGDLAILIESGISMCKALLLNLLSALTAFAGLYVSIMLGRNKEVELCLLSLTAGMFLYVAWIDMMAHLKHDGISKDRWHVSCAIQYAGFVLGFLLIFALGWFEGSFA